MTADNGLTFWCLKPYQHLDCQCFWCAFLWLVTAENIMHIYRLLVLHQSRCLLSPPRSISPLSGWVSEWSREVEQTGSFAHHSSLLPFFLLPPSSRQPSASHFTTLATLTALCTHYLSSHHTHTHTHTYTCCRRSGVSLCGVVISGHHGGSGRGGGAASGAG